MRYQIFKFITIFGFSLSLFLSIGQPVNAQLNCNIDTASGNPPSPTQILCPVARALNVIVWVSGAVFVIFVIFSAYKFAMAQGDPKGIQGAKDTFVLALMGFFAILFLFAIVAIIGRLFGVNYDLTPSGIIDRVYNGLKGIFNLGGPDVIVIDP